MSRSTSTSKKRPKVELNGKFYAYGDMSHLNDLQKMHRRGEIDLYAELQQNDGGPPLPPVADQWREDYRKRFVNVKSSRNR